MLRHALHVALRQNVSPLASNTAVHAGLICSLKVSLPGLQALTAPAGAPTSADCSVQLVSSLILPAINRGITAKVPKTTDDKDELGLLQKHAALSETLQKLGLSFSATMAVLKQCQRRGMHLSKIQGRIQQLQAYFGASLANDMLTHSAELLERDAQRLITYFEGLVQVVGGDKAFALSLVKKLPDLTQHKPEMIQDRIAEVERVLQVDRQSVLTLVHKAPVLLKLNPQRLTPLVDFMSKVAGLTPPEVFKVFLSWPMMASTAIKLVEDRYKVMGELLQASPEQMRRICRTFPNVLARDTMQIANNIDALAEKLRVPKDDLLEMLRNEPGLLSWNVSTLVNRIMAASQILKLTPKLSLTLLTYNRPIINLVQQLPQRLEALRRITGVTDDAALYSLVHQHLNILRFPIESNEAKLATVSSLSLLHPSWTAEWKVLQVSSKLRMMAAGWGCHWRLAYLVHTGQQGTYTMAGAIRMPHARFRELYPDFPEWLNRYNSAVSAADIPLDSSQLPVKGHIKLLGPSTYQAVLADASLGKGLHAGSLYVCRKSKQGQSGVSISQHQQANWLKTDASRSSGESDAHSSIDGSSSDGSSSSDDSDNSVQNADAWSESSSVGSASAGLTKRVLPGTPAGRLAGWLGIELAAAEQLLEHHKLHALRRREWHTRVTAAASFLGAVLQQPGAAAGRVCGGQYATDVVIALPGGDGDISSPHAAAVGGSAAASQLHGEALDQGQQQSEQQQPIQQASQQQLRQDVAYVPHPSGQRALQHAIKTQHAAAVAGVSVACLLVPFSQQLYSTPSRPPDYVVQFVVQHPDVFTKRLFVQNCTRLTTLAWSSTAFQQMLQQMPQQCLHQLMGCVSTRLKFLHYLVQTQQPLPWAIDLKILLLAPRWQGRTIESRFTLLYPGYEQWEKFHVQEL